MISPDRTYAVVVGIERYEAGPEWDLGGAAEAALRIIGWLRERDVPAENITVLLSPLYSNLSRVQQRLADLGFPTEPLPATVEKVRQVVTEQLPGKDGDLLVLFWSGHGVLDGRLERRLFCADAGIDAKYNINVTDLLAALSGKNFEGSDQVIIVDACTNFIQEMRLNLQAPESGFALGDTRSVSRDGLLAAAEGERALLDREASFGSSWRTGSTSTPAPCRRRWSSWPPTWLNASGSCARMTSPRSIRYASGRSCTATRMRETTFLAAIPYRIRQRLMIRLLPVRSQPRIRLMPQMNWPFSRATGRRIFSH